MDNEEMIPAFRVWGIDNMAYGPVELPVLVDWVRGGQVTADTWVYAEADNVWQKAAQMPELQMFFRRSVGATASPASASRP